MYDKSIRNKTLSVVLPCHNEEKVIRNSYLILKPLLDHWNNELISDYEIVMVNNGSTDDTIHEMRSIAKDDHKVVIVDLRKNYGYQGSITAGLFYAKNEMVVSIDADLQDDPLKMEDMIKMHYQGYDMVLGIRSARDTDSFFKKHTSQFFYKFSNLMGVKSVYNHGDYRLLSRSLVDNFKLMVERNRYIRGMILELESHYGCVYYERTKRMAGETKFNLYNMVALAVDGITSFSTTPIRYISFLGISMFLIALVGLIYVLYVKLMTNVEVPGWAFITLAILLFGGLQSLFIGIIGEYIAKIYTEVKQRPLFNVRTITRKGQIENTDL
ncbi:MAG: glycosyltransferase [Microcystis aeruginosa Ma_AC_P_19900807_S300]|nr:MAG: glycosyltransferase [Microcystis aeruginosa Ma_AC_P_19900807_S300]